MYKRELLPFSKVPQFSERDKAYQQEDPRLRPFYKHDVGLSSFANVIEHRAKFKTDRDILVRELLNSYEDIDNNATVLYQIRLLADPSTYTIVTAHQPSLLTGPLYFIYKICSAISLARQVDEAYDHVKVVPVFILGGEDHDFAEIATARLFGREFTWQTEQKGACGRMSTDRLEEVLREVQDTFGAAPHAEELMELIDRSVQNAKGYGDFMFRLVHELFGRHGLIIANMDNASMKQVLLPYLEKDLESQSSHQAVTADQASLEAAGFKAQAHAREVNIFLHREDRERVIWTGDGYQVGEELFHPDEFVEYLRSDPGRISPNVIMRPIFQEVILPNLAYVGGGGELAYWLERKTLFEAWDIPFPMLVRRDSVMIVDRRSAQTIENAGFSITDMFEREEQILGQYAERQVSIDISFDKERSQLKTVFDSMSSRAEQLDPTISKTALSEGAKAMKSIDLIESKLLRAAKQKNEVGLKKLSKIKHKLFPGNDGLQERYDNFIPYFLRYGQTWIEELLMHLNPLEKEMKILIEE